MKRFILIFSHSRRRVLALGMLALAALAPRPAAAGWIPGVDDVLGGVLGAIRFLLKGIGNMLWDLTQVFGKFLTWVLIDFNQAVGFVDNEMVQAGWVVVRDVANWFFIVFLLVAAISIILDLEYINGRKLVAKILVLALLINFSLFIIGFFINVSQVFMTLFVVNGAGPYGDIGLVLANAMGTGEGAISDSDTVKESAGGGLDGEILALSFEAVRILFGLGAAFIFLFLGVVLILRVVALWIVLILSPAALIASLMPKTRDLFQDWMKKTINWTMFGIFAAFFVWLATWLAQYLMTNPALNNIDSADVSGGNPMLVAIVEEAGFLMRYIAIFIFLFMSFWVSKRLAGELAGIAVGAMAFAGGAAAGAAGATRVAAMRGVVGEGVGKAAGVAGRRISKIPYVRRIPGIRGGAERLIGVQEGRRSDKGEAYNKAKDMSTANAVAFYNTQRRSVHARRGVAEVLAERGQLDQLPEAEVAKLQKEESKWRDSWKLRTAAPQLIENDEERKQALRRVDRNIAEKNSENFMKQGPEFMQEFYGNASNNAFRGLAEGARKTKEGFDDLQSSMRQSAQTIRSNDTLASYLRSSPGRRLVGTDFADEILGGGKTPGGRGRAGGTTRGTRSPHRGRSWETEEEEEEEETSEEPTESETGSEETA